MSNTSFISCFSTTNDHSPSHDTSDDCARSYIVAEQWLSTYRVSNNPRHLEAARICYAIADGLYSKFFGKD